MRTILSTVWVWLLLLVGTALQAQVNVSLSVAPPYPIHAEDLLQFEGQMVLTVTNQGSVPVPVKLLATVEGNNGVKISTKLSYLPPAPLMLTSGQTMVLTGAQLRNLNKSLTENDVDFVGVSRNQIIQTEQLPEGMYTLCVRAYNYQTGLPLSPEMSGCAPMYITWYDPPFLTFPTDNSACTPQTPQFQLFNWTPSGIPGKTRYRFELVDMTLNNLANPNDAFQTPAVQPVFKQQNILSTSLAYDLSKPALVKTHRYAWRVTAYDPMGSITFKNGGKSEVWSFKYGPQGGGVPNNDGPNNIQDEGNGPVMQYAPPCGLLACQPELPQGPAVTGGFQQGSKIWIGHFELELVSVTWNGDKISGTGRVDIPLFKCKVAAEFSNLKVNAQGKVLEGTATAQYDLGSNIGEALKSYANGMQGVNPEMIQGIHNQTKNGQKYINTFVQDQEKKLPFGFKTDKGQQLQIINISAIEFKATGARFNAFMVIPIPENNSKMGFGAKGICFHPTGFSAQTLEKLQLVGNDFTLPFGEDCDMKLLGSGQNGGTYISWDCEGYNEMQVEGEFIFDSNKLKPKKQGEQFVKARFTFNMVAWGDMLGSVDFDPFRIAGVEDLEFYFNNVTVDFSDYKNLPGMKFPAGYDGTKDNTWRGFYFKEISAVLPKSLKKGTDSISVAMKDCIIGKQGFTGNVTVAPLFGIGDGNVGKWAFSIDKITLKFINNSLTGSSFDGKIRIPIADTGIGYHCSLSSVNKKLGIEFGIENTDDLDCKMWIAQMHLEPGSILSVKVEGNTVICKADLTGNITIQDEFKQLTAIDLKVPGCKFENLVVSNGQPYLSCKKFSLTSPQKTLNGFNISFNPSEAPNGTPQNFKDMMGVELISNKDTCNLRFGFMISLHEGGNGISGFSSLTIHSKLNTANNTLVWKYEKTRVNGIAVDATLAVVKIKGIVEFYYGDDPTFGQGFRGHFSIVFKPKFEADATVQFGKVNGMKYWYVDANAKFPGIAVGPAFALYGFGGGAYYHMSPGTLPTVDQYKKDGDLKKNNFDVQAMGATDSGVKYTPNAGILFGFKASVVMGTFPSPRPFNGDVELEANFNGGGGLNMISLKVDAYFMCDLIDRTNPKVWAKGSITYMEAGGKRIFDASLEAHILVKAGKKPIVEGGGEFNIHVESAGMDGETGKWWVTLGTPEQPVEITLLGAAEVSSYLMLGNNIPGPPGLPDDIAVHLPSFKHSRTANGDVSGFGFGSKFKFDTGEMKFLIFYAYLKMQLGFDVFIMNDGFSCPNNPNPGINGYYAVGQMYAGFEAGVGIDIDVWFLHCKFELLSAYLYAGLQAGLPNPTWLRGEVSGGASILNGLAEIDFNVKFTAGEVCDPAANDPFGGLKIIGDVSPKSLSASVFSVPEAAFNVDLDKHISVDIINEEGEKNTLGYRFHLKDIVLERVGKKVNGKMTSISAEKVVGTPDMVSVKLAQFDKDEPLAAYSEYKMTIRVYGERLEKGAWVIIKDKEGKDTYYERKEHKFTTANLPDKFTLDNLQYAYPQRNQRYFYKSDVTRGVIHFNDDIGYLFKIKPSNSAYMYKHIVRFSKVMNGITKIAEVPLVYDSGSNDVQFNIPPDLQNERVYMIQFLAQLVKDPGQWLSAGNSTVKTETVALKNYYNQADQSAYGVKGQQRVIDGVTIKPDEHEFFRYFFRTSKYSSITNKWNDYKFEESKLGTGDLSHRLYGTYKGKEPWGKYDLRPYYYADGSDNSQFISPLIYPWLGDIAQYGNAQTGGLKGKINQYLYDEIRKYLFGGNTPCTEDALVKDWQTIMANRSHRKAPMAGDYTPHSASLAAHSFSDLGSAMLAAGLKYTGTGKTVLSNSDLTEAYGNGGGNQGGGGQSLANLSLGNQGGGGIQDMLPDLNLQQAEPPVENTMLAIWDFAHMSYYARKDFEAFLAGHANMGLCENGFRDNYFENVSGANFDIKHGGNYELRINYQRPNGTEGAVLQLYSRSISY